MQPKSVTSPLLKIKNSADLSATRGEREIIMSYESKILIVDVHREKKST